MKISDLPVLTDAKGNAFIPVVDPDETDPALRNKRIYLSTLSASVENFTPYDPAATYSKDGPDYVSYNNSIYEYIGLTPASGVLPTVAANWNPASAGRFAHVQNTDTGTTSTEFEFGKQNGTTLDDNGDPVAPEPHMLILLKMGKTAIRQFGEEGTFPNPPTFKLQFTNDYTGTGSDVWEDIGGNPIDDSITSNTTTYSSQCLEDEYFTFIYEAINDAEITATEAKVIAEGLEPRVDALEIAYKTGTVIDFVAVTTYFGTITTPETGNITANLTGATVGNMAFMFHNSGTEPTFGSGFNRLPGSGEYALGQTNRIIFHFLGGTTIDYCIQ